MLTLVKISGIDVSDYLINFSAENTYAEAINQAELKFIKGVNTAISLETGLTLEIWRGWTLPNEEKIFDGYIESFSPEGGAINIIGKDKIWDLIRKEMTHTYDSQIDPSAGKISEIFKDIVTTYGGLNADNSSVQDSGTAIIIEKFVCNHVDPYERCKALAKILDWQFYYRSDTDKVYFEPKGFTANALVLTVGNNVMQIPKWEHDDTEMVNDLTIVGAYQEVETTETGQIGITSGYTVDDIQLNFEPISVKLYADVSNPPTTLQVGGLPDSTSSYFYYIDKAQRKVYPATGTSFTTNHYFQILYSHAVPIPFNLYNQSSIDSYGRFQKTITYDDLRTVADAEQRGSNYLAIYSNPFLYTTLKVKNASTNSIKPGQLIRVVDNISNPHIDEYVVIKRQRIRYPGDYEELDVGDKSWRIADWATQIEEKLKRISEDQIANQEISNNLVTLDNTINPIQYQPRYRKHTTKTYSGTNLFVLGNQTYGILGTNKLGSLGVGSETDFFIQQYNNIYEEDFSDTDFRSSSTATWSGTLSFTSGQNAISSSIDYNNGTVTQAKITVTKTSGTFKIELTADGTNWEEVTSGTLYTFDNPGTDLRWKITENGGSTGVITNLEINNYH